jgi:hypothetical protein
MLQREATEIGVWCHLSHSYQWTEDCQEKAATGTQDLPLGLKPTDKQKPGGTLPNPALVHCRGKCCPCFAFLISGVKNDFFSPCGKDSQEGHCGSHLGTQCRRDPVLSACGVPEPLMLSVCLGLSPLRLPGCHCLNVSWLMSPTS